MLIRWTIGVLKHRQWKHLGHRQQQVMSAFGALSPVPDLLATVSNQIRKEPLDPDSRGYSSCPTPDLHGNRNELPRRVETRRSRFARSVIAEV
jgi:hypothetical protein